MRGNKLPTTAALAVAAILLCSRLALLANGPWEWDETLFARGVYRFQMAAHFPHPPGFPGWIAIGKLLHLLFFSDALTALQVASSVTTVGLFLASYRLAIILGAHWLDALMACTVASLLPGPWLHSVRGFSTLPASFFLALLLVEALTKARALQSTVWAVASVSVRPHLAPMAGLAWLAAAKRSWSIRSRAEKRREKLRWLWIWVWGALGALVTASISVALMAKAEGGLGAWWAAVADHASRHGSRLITQDPGWDLTELGIVKSFGPGFIPAAIALALSLAGALSAIRSGEASKRGAALLSLSLLIYTLELLFLHNRTYVRYAASIPFFMAPLAASAFRLVRTRHLHLARFPVWLLLVLVAFSYTYPLVVEQHASNLPGWRAVKLAWETSLRSGRELVAEAGLFPYASYIAYREGRGDRRILVGPQSPDCNGLPEAGRWVVATDVPNRYLFTLRGSEIDAGGISKRLLRYTQGRFLKASVLVDPLLPVGRWWRREQSRKGVRFMWAGQPAGLLVPWVAEGAGVRLVLEIPAKAAPLSVWIDGEPKIKGWRQRILNLDVYPNSAKCPAFVELKTASTYVPGGKDGRKLAVKLRGCSTVGKDGSSKWGGYVAFPAQRRKLGVACTGCYKGERFEGEPGVWLKPAAELSVPCSSGLLSLKLSAPRATRTGVTVVVGADDEASAWIPSLTEQRKTISLPIRCRSGKGVEVGIYSMPFYPCREVVGSQDCRELGVVLHSVEFVPSWALASGLTR